MRKSLTFTVPHYRISLKLKEECKIVCLQLTLEMKDEEKEDIACALFAFIVWSTVASE